MKRRQKLLADSQWKLIDPLLPQPKRRRDRRGRPPAPNRACLEGILWVLQTGAAWRFPPDQFLCRSTCRRRLQRWQEQGVWLNAWRTLLGTLDKRGLLKWDETFLDGSFAPAKKGARQSAKPSVARGRSGWYWLTVKVFRWEFGWKVPLRAKLTLRWTVAEVRVLWPRGRPRQKPKRIIADRGYDSDPLRERFKNRGIELIAPYREKNKLRRYEDGRKLRRYKRRCIVKELILGSGSFDDCWFVTSICSPVDDHLFDSHRSTCEAVRDAAHRVSHLILAQQTSATICSPFVCKYVSGHDSVAFRRAAE